MESEQKLSVKTKQLKKAKQLQTLANQKLEKEVSEEVPLLQLKVKSLTTETELLRMQLKHRNEEMEMFEKNEAISQARRASASRQSIEGEE